jgi:HD-like signal output (HDOD) protein
MFEKLLQWMDDNAANGSAQAASSTGGKQSHSLLHTNTVVPTVTATGDVVGNLQDVGLAFQSSLLHGKQHDPNLAPDPLETRIYKEVLADIRQGVRPEDLPRLPTIVTELLRRIEDEHSTYHDIVDLINREPALATEVLKEVNSPLYHVSSEPITSVEQAVGMLGLQRLNAITVTILMRDTFNISPVYFRYFGKYLWSHSQECAQISSRLAERAGADRFTAYLIGLIHDIGKLVIFQKLMQALKSSHPDHQPNPSVLANIIDRTSMQLSCTSLKHWELPMVVQTAICQQVRVIDPEQLSEQAYILYCANLLSEIQLLITEGKLGKDEADGLLQQHDLSLEMLDVLTAK